MKKVTIFVKTFALIAVLGVLGGCNADPQSTKASKENSAASSSTKQSLGTINISVGDKALAVEYADTPEKRQLGLMFRRELCDDCGMLFKFDSVRIGSIWMKNTYIPLDLAYINKDGKIVDIKRLKPHDLTSVKSSTRVLYALEMNQGWFAKNNIREGDIFLNLP